MNKNLLLWVIIIVVVTLTYLGMFFLGRNSVKAPVGTVEIKEHYVHDTTYAKPKPPIIIHDTTYATRTETTFTDSTSKSEQGASVKVKHTISEIDKNL